MSEFVGYLSEVFRLLGPIRSRPMFGGHGIFYDGFMIGLVSDDVLYLKTDKDTLPMFEGRGLHPFEYVKNGKRMKMSYSLAPEEVFDDAQIAKTWATRAYEAAVRAKKRTAKPEKRR